MDLRNLELFLHLADSLHFGKSADAMAVSPSTLSRAIQRLEQETGCVLFERDNRSVRLTSAGEKLREFGGSLLQEWRQLKQELNNQGIKVDNVGVYAGLADGGLPQGQDQQQAFQQGRGQQHSTRESAAAFEDGQELAAALAAQEGNTATDGVDYRI